MLEKNIKFRKYFSVLFLLMICFCSLLLIQPTKDLLGQVIGRGVKKDVPKKTVVIDPGHGGFDPGKVGVTGVLEKEINLKVALKVKELLEKNNVEVILTRDIDSGLYEEGDKNKKATDMRKRVELINNSGAVLSVSIHQNSFTQESIKGSQVFYYSQSEEGKEFAHIMQAKLKEILQDGNKREAKSNSNYYMLKKTTCPLVIVECGYLSNYKESELLVTDEYQEKLANAICSGIMAYIEEQEAAPTIAHK